MQYQFFYSNSDAVSLVENTLIAYCSLGWCLLCWQAHMACIEMWSALQRIQVENAHSSLFRASVQRFWVPDKIRKISALHWSNSCASLLNPQICSLCELFYLTLSPSSDSSSYFVLTCMLPAKQVCVEHTVLQPTHKSDISENPSVAIGESLLVAWQEINFAVCQHFYQAE